MHSPLAWGYSNSSTLQWFGCFLHLSALLPPALTLQSRNPCSNTTLMQGWTTNPLLPPSRNTNQRQPHLEDQSLSVIDLVNLTASDNMKFQAAQMITLGWNSMWISSQIRVKHCVEANFSSTFQRNISTNFCAPPTLVMLPTLRHYRQHWGFASQMWKLLYFMRPHFTHST